MFPFVRFAEGLLMAHACACAAFLIGSVVFPWPKTRDASSSSQIMLRVVCICALGYASIGFGSFVFAALGLFKLPIILIVYVLVLFGAAAFRRQYAWSPSFWSERLRLLAASWNVRLAIVYCAAIAIGLPAVLPNVGGDPIHYHLAYAQDWATTGSLVVDPFLRFPFWSNNFVLLYAIVLIFHGGPLLSFLTWSLGLLSALGVCALADDAIGEKRNAFAGSIPVLIACALILSPMYIRWLDSAYMDVPAGAFAQFSFTCIYLAYRRRETFWLYGAAVTAAFLLGMKPSYILLAPLFVLSVAFAARNLHAGARTAGAAIVLLLVLASPWYARNLVMAGDPVPPTLNVAFHGNDGFISGAELRSIESDLNNTPRTPSSLVTVPFRAFLAPNNRTFREYGVSALLMLLFAPPLFLVLAFGRHTALERPTILCTWMLLYLSLYWLLSSSILRYSLLFFPLLALSVALCMAEVLRRYPKSAAALAALSLLACIPSPGSAIWYREEARVYYRHLAETYTSDDAYLRLNDNGYAEERATARIFHQRRMHGIVYALGGDMDYFFRQDGLKNAGDWVGPGGFFRLYQAVDAGKGAEFVRALGATAVVIDPQFVLGGLDKPFEKQLLRAGFCETRLGASRYRLYLLCSSR
jgi:hypothetical protein